MGWRLTALDWRAMGFRMPAKKMTLTNEERAKRIRHTARKAETSNDPADFEKALGKVLKVKAAPLEPKRNKPLIPV